MEEEPHSTTQPSFYTIILPTQDISENQVATKLQNIPNEWYSPDQIEKNEYLELCLNKGFSASQWKHYFDIYTSRNFLDSNSRALTTRIHHHLRMLIIRQTVRCCRDGEYFVVKETFPFSEETQQEGQDITQCLSNFCHKVVLNKEFMHEQVCLTVSYKKCPQEVYTTQLADNLVYATQIMVIEGDCLRAALYLKNVKGLSPAVLNNANAFTPGGGYKSGAGAQEENLHRRTNYFQSLEDPQNIQGNKGGKYNYPLSDTGAIYSPNLIVFRHSEAEGYAFMQRPELMSFIAAAAPRRPRLIKDKTNNTYQMDSDAADLTKDKIRTILGVAVVHQHDCVVLGAFGCGAFRCPPLHVASLFREVIDEPAFKGRFKCIAFAILNDHNAHSTHNPEGNIKPFADIFETSVIVLDDIFPLITTL